MVFNSGGLSWAGSSCGTERYHNGVTWCHMASHGVALTLKVQLYRTVMPLYTVICNLGINGSSGLHRLQTCTNVLQCVMLNSGGLFWAGSSYATDQCHNGVTAVSQRCQDGVRTVSHGGMCCSADHMNDPTPTSPPKRNLP